VDAEQVSHPDVQVAVHRDEPNGTVKFGVILHGVFIPFAERKLGGFDKWLSRGQEREAQQQPTEQPQQPQQPPQA